MSTNDKWPCHIVLEINAKLVLFLFQMHMSVSERDSEILSENNCLSSKKEEEVEGGGGGGPNHCLSSKKEVEGKPSDVTTSCVTSSKTKTTNGNLSGRKLFYSILYFTFIFFNAK